MEERLSCGGVSVGVLHCLGVGAGAGEELLSPLPSQHQPRLLRCQAVQLTEVEGGQVAVGRALKLIQLKPPRHGSRIQMTAPVGMGQHNGRGRPHSEGGGGEEEAEGEEERRPFSGAALAAEATAGGGGGEGSKSVHSTSTSSSSAASTASDVCGDSRLRG